MPFSAASSQLALEGAALRRPRREIAEVVQAAFAVGDHFRLRLQRAQFGLALGGDFQRVVRMHAGGGVEEAGVRARQRQRRRASPRGWRR